MSLITRCSGYITNYVVSSSEVRIYRIAMWLYNIQTFHYKVHESLTLPLEGRYVICSGQMFTTLVLES